MAADTRIGTSIKRARERKRWTQRQLAAELGVNIKTVDNWENGRTSPRSSIGALEEILGVSLDGDAPPQDITPEDEWERRVLADATLPIGERVQIIRVSRRARAEMYPATGPRPAGDARAPRVPGSQAGIAARNIAWYIRSIRIVTVACISVHSDSTPAATSSGIHILASASYASAAIVAPHVSAAEAWSSAGMRSTSGFPSPLVIKT